MFTFIYLHVYVYVCMDTFNGMHVDVRNQLVGVCSRFQVWVPAIKLRLSGFAGGAWPTEPLVSLTFKLLCHHFGLHIHYSFAYFR